MDAEYRASRLERLNNLKRSRFARNMQDHWSDKDFEMDQKESDEILLIERELESEEEP